MMLQTEMTMIMQNVLALVLMLMVRMKLNLLGRRVGYGGRWT